MPRGSLAAPRDDLAALGGDLAAPGGRQPPPICSTPIDLWHPDPPCCHSNIDIGPQTWAYCNGNIHIWKTDRAAARDLEGVGAPSSILLEQIGGVGGDPKRPDKTRHFRNMRPHFLDTVVHSGRKWRFGTRASQKNTQGRGRKAGATGLGKQLELIYLSIYLPICLSIY